MKNSIKLCISAAIACVTTSSAYADFDLGSLLSNGIQTIQNATATSKFDAKDLIGTWNYVSPAVSFKGDNTLANLGGAAASTTVENKLATYYQKAGLQKSQLIVKEDLSFTFKLGSMSMTGTIEKSTDGNLIFNFKAFNKVNVGKVDCIATKSGNTINLTFDVSKVLDIAQKIASISSNSTFKTASSLLSNYKDMYVGMKMKR